VKRRGFLAILSATGLSLLSGCLGGVRSSRGVDTPVGIVVDAGSGRTEVEIRVEFDGEEYYYRAAFEGGVVQDVSGDGDYRDAGFEEATSYSVSVTVTADDGAAVEATEEFEVTSQELADCNDVFFLVSTEFGRDDELRLSYGRTDMDCGGIL